MGIHFHLSCAELCGCFIRISWVVAWHPKKLVTHSDVFMSWIFGRRDDTMSDRDLYPTLGSRLGKLRMGRPRAPKEQSVWDLLYGLQIREAAIGPSPSLDRVKAVIREFEQVAAQLEQMGEPEKALDIRD